MNIEFEKPPPWPPLPGGAPQSTESAESADPEPEPRGPKLAGSTAVKAGIIALAIAVVGGVATWIFVATGSPDLTKPPPGHGSTASESLDPTTADSGSSGDRASSSSEAPPPTSTTKSDIPEKSAAPPDYSTPSQPRNVEAHTLDDEIEVWWEEPADDGGLPVDSYGVYSCKGKHLMTVDGDTPKARFPAGETSCVAVHATNKVGAGPETTAEVA